MTRENHRLPEKRRPQAFLACACLCALVVAGCATLPERNEWRAAVQRYGFVEWQDHRYWPVENDFILDIFRDVRARYTLWNAYQRESFDCDEIADMLYVAVRYGLRWQQHAAPLVGVAYLSNRPHWCNFWINPAGELWFYDAASGEHWQHGENDDRTKKLRL